MTDKREDAAADLLIREVDEELRQDQLTRLWKRYGGVAIGAAVALVAAVAGWQVWGNMQAEKARAASERFSAALEMVEKGNHAAAAEALAGLSAEGTAGYRLLAEMERADLRLQAGDVAGAVEIYERIAADGGVDGIYRDLARLKAAYLQLDSADPVVLSRSVEALAADSSPWRHSAREVQALAAERAGDRERARTLLKILAEDAAAPQGVRTRAGELLAALGNG